MGVIWAVVSVLGFAVEACLIVALGRRVTAPYEAAAALGDVVGEPAVVTSP